MITYGHAAFEGGGSGPSGFSGFQAGGGFSDIFEDLFSEFTGGSRRSNTTSSNRGSDLRFNLEVSLSEAYSGIKKLSNLRLQLNVIHAMEQALQEEKLAYLRVLLVKEVVK